MKIVWWKSYEMTLLFRNIKYAIFLSVSTKKSSRDPGRVSDIMIARTFSFGS